MYVCVCECGYMHLCRERVSLLHLQLSWPLVNVIFSKASFLKWPLQFMSLYIYTFYLPRPPLSLATIYISRTLSYFCPILEICLLRMFFVLFLFYTCAQKNVWIYCLLINYIYARLGFRIFYTFAASHRWFIMEFFSRYI